MRHALASFLVTAATVGLVAPGPAGATAGVVTQGPAVAAAPKNCDRCFATVLSDATVVHSRGVVTSSKMGTGHYLMRFKYPVDKCAINTTPDSVKAEFGVDFSEIAIERQSTKSVEVLVFTRTYNQYVDGNFSLAVTC